MCPGEGKRSRLTVKESPHSRGLQAIGSKHEIWPNEGPEGKHPLAPLSVSHGIRGIAPSHIVATDMAVSIVGGS